MTEERVTPYRAAAIVLEQTGRPVHPQTLYAYVQSGKIPSVDKMVLPSDVLAWAEARPKRAPHPAPELPADSTPELVAMNEALWTWVDTGSFDVKVALMQCMDDHDPEARLINRCIGDIARAWGEYLATLPQPTVCSELVSGPLFDRPNLGLNPEER